MQEIGFDFMKWSDLIKKGFGAQQVPKPSTGSKQKNIGTKIKDNLKPIPQPQTIKYEAYITQQYSGSLYGKWFNGMGIEKQFSTRKECFEHLKQVMADNGNPKPWIVEGTYKEGHAVCYDGMAMMMNAPMYYYIIIKVGDKLPDAASFSPHVDWTTGARVMDRMNGVEYRMDDDES